MRFKYNTIPFLPTLNKDNHYKKNTLKNELMEIFRGFRVFEYALWQKTKTRKYRKLTESFLNKKTPIVNGLSLLENCYKATNVISKHHFGFHNKTRKATFKLQW